MKQFTLDLDKDMQRPIVYLSNYPTLTALLDTGAYFPIWTSKESTLTKYLGAELVKKDVCFGGFGGSAKGNLYKMHFTIGELIFPNMYIIACMELKVPFHMILSATMFQNLIYEIDDKNHKLNISVPDNEQMVRNLKIVDSNGNLHVLCIDEYVSGESEPV